MRKGGLEPPPLAGPDPTSGASANSATFAHCHYKSSLGFIDSAGVGMVMMCFVKLKKSGGTLLVAGAKSYFEEGSCCAVPPPW